MPCIFAAREENTATSKEYTRGPNYTLKPQPFAITKSYDGSASNGYPVYDTYPTPQFYPYNQTQYSSTTASPTYQDSSYQTTPESQFTYYAPDDSAPENKPENSDNNYPSNQGAIIDDLTTIIALTNDSFSKPDDNSINELEPSSANHPPHIHSIDVQCSKDKMAINIEFNEVFNGIIYSKV